LTPKKVLRIHYARIRSATTGNVKISELATHQIELISPRILPLTAMIAAPNAARPLKRAVSSAINPRVRHPSTSTGVEAITKKTAGMIAGIIM
jgi:prophage antirepressor-like protein